MRKWLLIILLLIFTTKTAYAVDINNCSVINESGYYRLTTDILNFGEDITCDNLGTPPCVLEYQACIVINASDVVFDCDNHFITGNLSIVYSSDKKPPAGIVFEGVSNISIYNCNLYNLTYPIRGFYTSDFKAENISYDLGAVFYSTYGAMTNIYAEGLTPERFNQDSITYCGGNPCSRLWYVPAGEVPVYKPQPRTIWIGIPTTAQVPAMNITSSYFFGSTALEVFYNILNLVNVTLGQYYAWQPGFSSPDAVIVSTAGNINANNITVLDKIDYSLFPNALSVAGYFVDTHLQIVNSKFIGFNLTFFIDNTNETTCLLHNNLFNLTGGLGAYVYPYSRSTIYCSWNNTQYGNYWGYINGTGYSDTCLDSDSNGICDSPFNVTSDGTNIDYFPLSKYFTTDVQLETPPPADTEITIKHEDNLLEVCGRIIDPNVLIYFNDTVLVVNINDTNYTVTSWEFTWLDSIQGYPVVVNPQDAYFKGGCTYIFQKVLPPGNYTVKSYLIWKNELLTQNETNFTVFIDDWFNYSYPKRTKFIIENLSAESSLVKLKLPINDSFLVRYYCVTGNTLFVCNALSDFIAVKNNEQIIDAIYFDKTSDSIVLAISKNDVSLGDEVYIYYGIDYYDSKPLYRKVGGFFNLTGVLDVSEDVYLYSNPVIVLDDSLIYYIDSNRNVIKKQNSVSSYIYTGGDAISLSVGVYLDSLAWISSPTIQYYYICVLTGRGNVYCYNEGNAPDVGQIITYTKGDAVQVSSAPKHTCILTKSGDVHCFGENNSGQIINYQGAKLVVASGTNYVGRTCVLDETDTLRCFGSMNDVFYDVAYADDILAGVCVLFKNNTLSCFCDNITIDSSNIVSCPNGESTISTDVVLFRSELNTIAYLHKSSKSVTYKGEVPNSVNNGLTFNFNKYLDYVTPSILSSTYFATIISDPKLYIVTPTAIIPDPTDYSLSYVGNSVGFAIYPSYATYVPIVDLIFAQLPFKQPETNMSVYVVPKLIKINLKEGDTFAKYKFTVGVNGDSPLYVYFDASKSIKDNIRSPSLGKYYYIEPNQPSNFDLILYNLTESEYKGVLFVYAELPDRIEKIPIYVIVTRKKITEEIMWWLLIIIAILYLKYYNPI